MTAIPDTWFEENVNEVATEEQTTAFKAYLSGEIEAEEAATLLTADVHRATLADTTEAKDINCELRKLWTFLIDVILSWPSVHLHVANLLDGISKLPHVDRTGRDNLEVSMDGTGTIRAMELWQDLPKFWNLFSDYWHSLAGWPYSRLETNAEKGDNLSWTNINSFAAIVFMGGPFAGMPILGNWGCYVIKKATQSDYEPIELHIPSAAVWMRFAGDELRDFYSTRYEGPLMWERWNSWRSEFEKTSKNDTVGVDYREWTAELAALM
ncbi:hypothetical protein F4811DRAFT_234014 [Daldinia bambusicola]|nr:hypothetical protein F4811DRAFT_234014 [Daldinia bambusicola]